MLGLSLRVTIYVSLKSRVRRTALWPLLSIFLVTSDSKVNENGEETHCDDYLRRHASNWVRRTR